MKVHSLPCYCATLRQAARAATALYQEVLAQSPVNATQFTALQLLKNAPDLATTELAELLGMDQTTATRTLALIRKLGLAIDRRGSDRREKRWALTPAGDAAFRKLNPIWEEAQALFEKRLGGKDAANAVKKTAYDVAKRLGAQ